MNKFRLPDPGIGLPKSTITPDERKRRDEEYARRERERPCYGQNRENTKAWMKEHAREGLVVVIRSTITPPLSGEWDYVLDEIIELNPRRGRFYTKVAHSMKSSGRSAWYYSGQSADTPAGQVDLIIPTPAVVQKAIEQKRGFLQRHHHDTLIQRAKIQTKTLFNEDLD